MSVNGEQSNVGCTRYFYVDDVWWLDHDLLWRNANFHTLFSSKRG